MVVIALTIKQSITPHIHSCKTSQHTWGILETMYHSMNEARVHYWKRQLDKPRVQEGDNMADHLTKIQYL